MNNIVLIGFMGSGKTTIGKLLQEKTGFLLLDSDREIEKEQGKKISEIFKQQGESAFRKMEADYLEKLSKSDKQLILSTGGGMPLLAENAQRMKKVGKVIYLKASGDTIYQRVKADTDRPLLQTGDRKKTIEELLEKRDPLYKKAADIIIETDGLELKMVVDEILHRMRDSMKLLIINGPNLNFLGIREKNIYGNQDYDYLLQMIADKGKEIDAEIEVFQSNHEGAIIDRIQDAYFDGTQAIVINPGAFTHYSYAIHDALQSVSMPKIEIHISDITKREEFRKVSVTAPACSKQIYGEGLKGYLHAIDEAVGMIIS